MVEALVEYEYDAVNADELSFKVGEVISSIAMMDGGWWEGELNGKRGMFPDNFVKVITDKQSPKKSPTAAMNGQASQDVIKRENSTQKRKMRAKVTFSYAPQNEDELLLEVDEEIEIKSQPEEGWWEGVVNGKTGMFPSNFVSLVSEEDDRPEEGAKERKTKPPINKPGFGNIFSQGQVKLRPTPGVTKREIPANNSKRNSLKNQGHAPEPANSNKAEQVTGSSGSKEKAVVEYDYDPTNGDELQLKKGETVTNIVKDTGDKGWWKGEVNGKVGVFPDNFVKIVPAEPEQKTKVPPVRPGPAPAKGSVKAPAAEKVTPAVAGRDKTPGGRQVLPMPAKKPKPRPVVKPVAKEPVKKEDPSKDVFGDLKSSSDKLAHPTKDRPRFEHKRPPTSAAVAEKSAATTNLQSDTAASAANSSQEDDPALPPWSRELKSKSLRKSAFTPLREDTQQTTDNNPVTASSRPASSFKSGLSPGIGGAGGGAVSAGGGASSPGGGAVSAPSNQALDELRGDVRALRAEMEKMSVNFKRDVDSLMQEVDEEKKLRLSMQVELERIRRLVKH